MYARENGQQLTWGDRRGSNPQAALRGTGATTRRDKASSRLDHSGERGIRTPVRRCASQRLAVVPDRPLWHLSNARFRLALAVYPWTVATWWFAARSVSSREVLS